MLDFSSWTIFKKNASHIPIFTHTPKPAHKMRPEKDHHHHSLRFAYFINHRRCVRYETKPKGVRRIESRADCGLLRSNIACWHAIEAAHLASSRPKDALWCARLLNFNARVRAVRRSSQEVAVADIISTHTLYMASLKWMTVCAWCLRIMQKGQQHKMCTIINGGVIKWTLCSTQRTKILKNCSVSLLSIDERVTQREVTVLWLMDISRSYLFSFAFRTFVLIWYNLFGVYGRCV